jgi:carbonic anhydrase
VALTRLRAHPVELILSMRDLLFGLLEFRERSLGLYRDRFRELSEEQAPDTLLIACSDSRVVPSLLTSAEPGELFVVRNVGNLIPPATDDGTSSGDLSEASAIEYAVVVLQVRNIVVCGHSNCGAMRAIGAAALDDAPNLQSWLQHAQPALAMAHRPSAAKIPLQDRISQCNVLVQLEHLATYPAVRRGLAQKTLSLAGWWFDIATGEMRVYDPVTSSFVPLNRESIDRLTQSRPGP